MFILNANEPKELASYLKKNQWLSDNETIVSATKPGEGNMNYVLRIETEQRTFIIKQSRAYVEKYPQVAAPASRVVTEAGFYQKISEESSIQNRMPKLLGLDTVNNILLLEDLGKSNDYSVLYDLKHRLTTDEVIVLVSYLNELHIHFEKNKVDDELANVELRKLNYEHIFKYPFLEENGFDLDSIQMGLQELALPYKKDAALKVQLELLGSLYLSKGKYLLHGDYYPGSWLKTVKGIQIIDPEFCYYGSREFDLGVFIAHLYLSQQDENLIAVIAKEYTAFADLNPKILNGFVGIEIMRRLIGLAQLPLQMNVKEKADLLIFARELILE
ncbi:5-methylthioribose kinase [Flavobacterium micromati]|uniref:5-methylthioribose kinase n=1 Tax=Flavobacterium micromati TaxID=229205 RepID=A0A1M5ITZ3_9FLAO|nr:phosphotransferase [Flavobacterium micromati]SHG31243.1 5-methylthioribose kinase [Flavobacterium micromati]